MPTTPAPLTDAPPVNRTPGVLRGRVLILLAIALTALNLRTAVTGFSAIADRVGADLALSPTALGAVGTVVTACFAVFGFAAPFLVRRIGLERTAVLALVATALGVGLRASSDSTATLLASTALAFAGVGTSNVVVIPLVKEYFPDRIKALSTGYLVLLQVGQFAAPLLAVALVTASGWRLAVGIWAVPLAVAAVLWVLVAVAAGRRTREAPAAAAPAASVVPEPSAESGASVPSGASATPGATAAQGVPSGARRRRPAGSWGLVILFGATSFHVYSLITWLPAMFIDAGISVETGAVLLALFSSLGLVAAFVVPAAAGRSGAPFLTVLLCAALLAVGYVGMLAAPREGAVLWAVALGLGVSTFPLCMTLVAARSTTSAEASALSGLMQGIGYAIACIGPILLGILIDATASWTPALIVLIASLAVTVLAGRSATRLR